MISQGTHWNEQKLKTTVPAVGKDMEQGDSSVAFSIINWHNYFKKWFGHFYKNLFHKPSIPFVIINTLKCMTLSHDA